jgi:hypothetical protein
MKRGVIIVLILVLLIFISSCEEEPILSPDQEGECGEVVPGVINIKFKEGYDLSTPSKVSKMVANMPSKEDQISQPKQVDKIFLESNKIKNKVIQEKIGVDRWVKIKISPKINLYDELAKWASRPEVEQASLEYYPCLLLTPNDNPGRYKAQWHHNNTGDNLNGINSTPDADIDSPEAWDIQTGNGIVVAVPDTSVFWHHEDLIENIWQNLGEDADGDGKTIQPNGTEYIYYDYPADNYSGNRSYTKYIFDPEDINGIDDDENGYVDDFIGWDFLGNDNDPNYELSDSLTYQWHGTSTMGCFAATGNNSLGQVGSCWNCKVMGMRRGVGSVAAVQYAIENGAKVISMSWLNSDPVMMDTLEYAHELGIVLLAGAGNEAPSGRYNAMCSNEDIICVSGSTMWDTTWGKSSYYVEKGITSDLASPSATIFNTFAYNHPLTIYGASSGTSLGTPIAGGVVALILSENPNLSPDEIKSILQSSTDPFVSVQTGTYSGVGRLNAGKALNLTVKTKEYGGFPISLISGADSFYNPISFNVIGTANSTNFSKYEIYYSEGHYSNNWTFLENSTSPVQEGEIASVALTDLPLGVGQIKVVVYDNYNQTAFDTIPYFIDHYPTPANESLDLQEGWNLYSPKIESIFLSSKNFSSFLVAGYNSTGWQFDINFEGVEGFNIKPWQGYMIYSKENISITLEGYIPDSMRPSLEWMSWNLVSFNESKSFTNLYFSYPPVRIWEITNKNNTFSYIQKKTDDNLTRGNLYWLTLNPDVPSIPREAPGIIHSLK